MKVGRKPEYPEKTPGDELQKMSHTTARRFKPQARLEPANPYNKALVAGEESRRAIMTPREAIFYRAAQMTRLSNNIGRMNVKSWFILAVLCSTLLPCYVLDN